MGTFGRAMAHNVTISATRATRPRTRQASVAVRKTANTSTLAGNCGWTPRRTNTPKNAWLNNDKRKTRLVTAMGLFGLGLPEVAVIAGVAVLLFGPSKIPELGKTLGKTVRGLQDATQEFKEELDAELAKGPEDDETTTKSPPEE